MEDSSPIKQQEQQEPLLQEEVAVQKRVSPTNDDAQQKQSPPVSAESSANIAAASPKLTKKNSQQQEPTLVRQQSQQQVSTDTTRKGKQTSKGMKRSMSVSSSSSNNTGEGGKRRKRSLFSILISVVMTVAILQIVLYEYHHYAPMHDLTLAAGSPDKNQKQQQQHHHHHQLFDHSEWKIGTAPRNNSGNTTTTRSASNSSSGRRREMKKHQDPRGPKTDEKKQHDESNLVQNDVHKEDNEIQQKHLQHPVVGGTMLNPIHALLKQAKVWDTLTPDERAQLPALWKTMSDLYYGPNLEQPIIIGMETCQRYREQVPENKRYAAVAGLFNTGTNAMEHHLRRNLKLHSAWQVPWGKHRMEFVRLNHTAPGMTDRVKENCLPVVVIRDPYHWLHSMCKSPYAAYWKHSRGHCPNLVPDEKDQHGFSSLQNTSSVEVEVKFDKQQIFRWKSLVHLWSNWYKLYLDAGTSYPRLIMRFEDMLLHGPLLLQKIAECTGSEAKEFEFQTGAAKAHGSSATFLKAITKTGDLSERTKYMTAEDLTFARDNLDKDLMRIFQYRHPEETAGASGSIQ